MVMFIARLSGYSRERGSWLEVGTFIATYKIECDVVWNMTSFSAHAWYSFSLRGVHLWYLLTTTTKSVYEVGGGGGGGGGLLLLGLCKGSTPTKVLAIRTTGHHWTPQSSKMTSQDSLNQVFQCDKFLKMSI